jgi:hypothetical protein
LPQPLDKFIAAENPFVERFVFTRTGLFHGTAQTAANQITG